MYRLAVEGHFDAAHYIKDYVGKCSNQHGHRWVAKVFFIGEELDERNILLDFSFIKKLMNDILDEKLDHQQLNNVLTEPNVTAEYLAEYIYNYMADLNLGTVHVEKVSIAESPDCVVEYWR